MRGFKYRKAAAKMFLLSRRWRTHDGEEARRLLQQEELAAIS